jgi:hypothetical protein
MLLSIHYCKILRHWTIYHKLVLFVRLGRLLKDERLKELGPWSPGWHIENLVA